MMIRTVGLTLFCAAGLFTTNVFAEITHPFTQGQASGYVLRPNEPQVFMNIFPWTVNATCVFNSANELIPLGIKVLDKSGSFNGTRLSKGDSLQVTAYANKPVYLSAEPGSKVELKNTGSINITIECSIG